MWYGSPNGSIDAPSALFWSPWAIRAKGAGGVRMPPAPDRLINEYTDNSGGYLRTSNWIAAGMASGPLNASIQAAINAAFLYSTQGLPFIGTSTPGITQYHLCQDVALLNFATIPGTSLQLALPGPLVALFGPNSTVVDPTNPLVAAIIAQAIGVLADPAGNPVTAYISGSKASRRTEQL